VQGVGDAAGWFADSTRNPWQHNADTPPPNPTTRCIQDE
jgi:hypothetical protein